MLERVHKTIGNILRTSKVQNMVLGDENPWEGILVSTIFALRAMVHTTTQYTSVQLVFGRDSIINRRHDVEWETIKTRKQDLIKKDNKRENLNQIKHTFK